MNTKSKYVSNIFVRWGGANAVNQRLIYKDYLVLTTFDTWAKALSKESLNCRYKRFDSFEKENSEKQTYTKKLGISNPDKPGICSISTKDHLEVFLPNVK